MSTESFGKLCVVLVVVLFILLLYVIYRYRLVLEPPKFDQLPYVLQLKSITKWLRSHRKHILGIEIYEKGGYGHDGRVYFGTALILPENLKNGTTTTADHAYLPSCHQCAFKQSHPIQKFSLITLQEAKRLITLSHKNLIYCYGVASIDSFPMLVLQYQNGGNLKDYFYNLREGKISHSDGSEVNEITIGHIVYVLQSVANAIEYLHNSNYLHRDIAARNVLIHFVDKPEGRNQVLNKDNCNIVVCDMALSCRNDDVTTISVDLQLPVPWLAPEILEPYLSGRRRMRNGPKSSTSHRLVYTTAADVWSFACFGYEILHLCKFAPHQNCLNCNEIHRETLKPNHGLPLPHETPEALCQLISDCLKLEASSRPSFTEIIERLKEMEENSEEMNVKLDTGIIRFGSPPPPPELPECSIDYYKPNSPVKVSPV